MGRLLGRIVVGLTICLISFISYSSQIFVIWPWYGRELSVELITLLAPFNLLVGMLFWNYWLCVVTDPGSAPDKWEPDTNSLEGYEVKKLTGHPRYCRMCDKYKPPRAHHCKQCKKCVLRMDHHCPWVNNCVGYFNHGHFIRFLFYVDIACTYHVTMVTKRVLHAMRSPYYDAPGGSELVFIVLNYVTCVPVLLMVGGFSSYHFYCLLGNSTTIEGWEKQKVATLVRRGKIRQIKFPYNIGRRRNIESMLGKNPLLWCWPTVPPGTGLKYQLAEGEDVAPQEAWPPRDPTARPDPNYKLILPDSPWTYENGGINPNLRPNPSDARHRSASQRRQAGIAAAPPWHPDHEAEETAFDHDSLASSDEEGDIRDGASGPRIRRGSEGYEIQAVDREEILRRYIESRGEEAGRYNRYVPEPPSESETDEEEPLAKRVDKWRAEEAVA